MHERNSSCLGIWAVCPTTNRAFPLLTTFSSDDKINLQNQKFNNLPHMSEQKRTTTRRKLKFIVFPIFTSIFATRKKKKKALQSRAQNFSYRLFLTSTEFTWDHAGWAKRLQISKFQACATFSMATMHHHIELFNKYLCMPPVNWGQMMELI